MEKQPGNITHFYYTKEMQRNEQPGAILHLYSRKDKAGTDNSFIKYTNRQGKEVTVMMAEVRKDRLKKKIFQPRPNWVTEHRPDGYNYVFDANRFPGYAAKKQQKKTEEETVLVG